MPEVRENVHRATSLMQACLAKADFQGVDLLCFPECYLQGYLTEYSAAKKHALNLQSPAFADLLARFSGFRSVFVFGFIEAENGCLFNSAAVVHQGRLVGRYRKTHLLSGEAIFQPGFEYPVFDVDGLCFGINICYDTNFNNAAAAVAERGGKLILCPANNMMRLQVAERMKPLHNECRAQRAKETGCWLVSSDVTGRRDNRISYGPTAVINPAGIVLAQVPLLQTGMVLANIHPPGLTTKNAAVFTHKIIKSEKSASRK
jgi:predicted amidohydrolase